MLSYLLIDICTVSKLKMSQICLVLQQLKKINSMQHIFMSPKQIYIQLVYEPFDNCTYMLICAWRKQAWLGQQHDMETLSKKIKNRFVPFLFDFCVIFDQSGPVLRATCCSAISLILCSYLDFVALQGVLIYFAICLILFSAICLFLSRFTLYILSEQTICRIAKSAD